MVRVGTTVILSQTDPEIELMSELIGPSSTVTPTPPDVVASSANASVAERPTAILDGDMTVVVAVGVVALVRNVAPPPHGVVPLEQRGSL